MIISANHAYDMILKEKFSLAKNGGFMEEIESPVEQLGEEIHHIAEHAKESWIKWSALLSALFAVLAAIAGLQAGHEINEAMIEQIRASDAWGYYQAKGIKGMIIETLPQQNDETTQKAQKYKDEQKTIKEDAEVKVASAEHHLHGHEILARAVTLLQVAIAMTAIAVLTRRKRFLLFSVGMGAIGSLFFIQYWLF